MLFMPKRRSSVTRATWAKSLLAQVHCRLPGLARQVAGIPADTQIAYLKGDEWGFGWNAGILYELDKNNRYGLTYRSEVKIDFDGDYKSSLPSAYNQILGNFGLPMGTGGRTTGGSLSLHLPNVGTVRL
jgi:long-chain fatty acid transport protein